MYIPHHFNISDEQEILRFVDANSFAQLISRCAGQLFSTHIPVTVAQDLRSVTMHLAAGNPQHRELDGQEVLITLQGPHAYVSPTWYDSPGVPTWNFQAVHIYGRASLYTQREKLAASVRALAQRFEGEGDDSWDFNFREEMLAGIVGVEVAVSDIQCKYKLSQNRSEDDRRSVARHLQALGLDSLSEAIDREIKR